jgi:hypothetical protein
MFRVLLLFIFSFRLCWFLVSFPKLERVRMEKKKKKKKKKKTKILCWGGPRQRRHRGPSTRRLRRRGHRGPSTRRAHAHDRSRRDGLGPTMTRRGLGPRTNPCGLGPMKRRLGLGPIKRRLGLGPRTRRGLGPTMRRHARIRRGLGPRTRRARARGLPRRDWVVWWLPVSAKGNALKITYVIMYLFAATLLHTFQGSPNISLRERSRPHPMLGRKDIRACKKKKRRRRKGRKKKERDQNSPARGHAASPCPSSLPATHFRVERMKKKKKKKKKKSEVDYWQPFEKHRILIVAVDAKARMVRKDQ